MEHHPYPEDNRQHYQGDARIAAQEEAQEQVQYAAHDAVAAGGEVVAAGGADYELHYAGDEHQYAEHDAEGEIALYGVAEYDYACNDGEDTGNQVQPPVADLIKLLNNHSNSVRDAPGGCFTGKLSFFSEKLSYRGINF